jgi:hypothetical protein
LFGDEAHLTSGLAVCAESCGPGNLHLQRLVAIAAGAGAAGVLNMWYEADIDAVMARTAMRPIPRGSVTRPEALAFGLVLAGGGIAVLGIAANVKAAGLLAFAILFYVVVYTIWLKRRMRQNIVIGGRGRRAAASNWLGSGNGRDWVRASCSIRHCLPVDAAHNQQLAAQALAGAGRRRKPHIIVIGFALLHFFLGQFPRA